MIFVFIVLSVSFCVVCAEVLISIRNMRNDIFRLKQSLDHYICGREEK